jgi:hypothetical protein
MSDSKIQVKVGIVEFSGEGEQEWLAAQLDKILEKVPELLKIEMAMPGNIGSNGQNGGGHGSASSGGVKNLSVLNITGKLGTKSGGDLVTAAGAYLHFIENKQAFSRDEITQTMKKAVGIYKDSMSANLTTTLAQLEKNGTLTKSGNSYSLQINKVTELDAILSK